MTCAVAAAVFAVLSVIQFRALPSQRAGTLNKEGMLAQWRIVVANKPFLLFAMAMICSYVLSFQVYLALPLEVRRVGGDGSGLWALAVLPCLAAAVLLAIGTMLAFPFEMDTIVALSGNRLVATHYGICNTICGLGITVGNLLTGAALDAARAQGLAGIPWLTLVALGSISAALIVVLHRSGRLTPAAAAAHAP